MRWWRVFKRKISGSPEKEAPADGGVTARRRKHTRYGFATKLSAKCSSWPKFIELFTGDISAGGLYVPTEHVAELGERVQLDLMLPNESTLPLTGTVVNVISAEQAAKLGKRQGLGIKFEPLIGKAKKMFDSIISSAKDSQPRPEPLADLLEPEANADSAETTSEGDAGSDDQITINAVEQAIDARQPPEPSSAPKSPSSASPPSSAPSISVPTGLIVGIDLGTTYTSIAAVHDNKVVIIENEHGEKSTPSVISFPRGGAVIVGVEARLRLTREPARTVVSPKRLLGRKFSDREVQTFTSQAAYRTLEGPDGGVLVQIGRDQYTIEQICAYLMRDVRDLAEKVLGEKVKQAVVSVPVTFDERRVEAVRRAGKLAQIDIIAVLDEPSAAALSNRFDPDFGGIVGVFDFGGGTFDFSVVDVSGGDFQVMATAGDTWLGGDDFDAVLAEAAANQFWREHKVDLRKMAVEWQRLLYACEKAKRKLSVEETATIMVPDVLRTADGMVDLSLGINRTILERACSPVIQRALDTCDEAFALLDMKPSDLSSVYLSGGTTYIPAVRQALADHFKVPVRTGVPPEHAVCLGAAIHAAQIQAGAEATLETR